MHFSCCSSGISLMSLLLSSTNPWVLSNLANFSVVGSSMMSTLMTFGTGRPRMFTDRMKIKRHDSKSIQKRLSSKVRLDRFKLADIAVPIKDHPTSFLILTNINTQIFCPRVSFVDSFKPALQRNTLSYIGK